MDNLPQIPSTISRLFCAAAAVSLILLSAGIQDTSRAVDVIAAQIRRQGHICKNPTAAELIKRETPLQKVYLLKCQGIVYRVRIVPDRTATVTKID